MVQVTLAKHQQQWLQCTSRCAELDDAEGELEAGRNDVAADLLYQSRVQQMVR
jgi:hypothetical protein